MIPPPPRAQHFFLLMVAVGAGAANWAFFINGCGGFGGFGAPVHLEEGG